MTAPSTAYILVFWTLAHMHVVELHPKHIEANMFTSLYQCEITGAYVVSMMKRPTRYRCEVDL